jgi:RNA polymerase sigma-70 factor (ECF subfamily)
VIQRPPSIANEERLVQQAQRGDQCAFEDLVRRYQDRLFTSLIRLTGSRDDAEDFVQEAMIQAYLRLNTFQGKSSFYTWLYRIAINLVFSGRRRRRLRTVSLEHVQSETGREPSDPSGAPGKDLERAEESKQIQRAFAELSEEHRAVLLLRTVEGFDYETIGRVLQLNAGTVRSRIHRARMDFRARLNRRVAPGSSCPQG